MRLSSTNSSRNVPSFVTRVGESRNSRPVGWSSPASSARTRRRRSCPAKCLSGTIMGGFRVGLRGVVDPSASTYADSSSGWREESGGPPDPAAVGWEHDGHGQTETDVAGLEMLPESALSNKQSDL